MRNEIPAFAGMFILGSRYAENMTRLYLITPPQFDVPALAGALPAVLDAVDVACVQLRLKDAGDDAWKQAIDALMPLCHKRDIAFILNDRVELARQMGCDGVHLGKDDAPYERARAALGTDRIVGISCYASTDLAMDAAEQGADYVAFGSVFPSETKADAPLAPLSVLEDWAAATLVPCVAIGGITPENCGPLVDAGVDFLAVIGAVWNHPDGPAAGAKAFHQVLNKI
jgi:thiamine-phosphate pyrophosphorylase